MSTTTTTSFITNTTIPISRPLTEEEEIDREVAAFSRRTLHLEAIREKRPTTGLPPLKLEDRRWVREMIALEEGIKEEKRAQEKAKDDAFAARVKRIRDALNKRSAEATGEKRRRGEDGEEQRKENQ